MDGVDDPVDTGITADSLVLRIDEDNLEVLVGRVLVDPVGVEDTKIGASTANTLFSGGTERALIFELIDTLVGRLACDSFSVSIILSAFIVHEILSYHRWHPLVLAACDYHVSRGCGR